MRHHNNEQIHAATHVALNSFKDQIMASRWRYDDVEIHGDSMSNGIREGFKRHFAGRVEGFEEDTGAGSQRSSEGSGILRGEQLQKSESSLRRGLHGRYYLSDIARSPRFDIISLSPYTAVL